MGGLHDAEVALINGRDAGDPEPLGDSDLAGVGAPETEIGVTFDEFSDTLVVAGGECFD